MRYLLILISLFTMASCTKKTYPSHNSMNSLDWSGVYIGMLKNNIGVETKTVIKLNEDLTCTIVQNDTETKGDFAWSTDGGKIVLLGLNKPEYFMVGENYLKTVSKKGKELKNGEYILNKTNELSIVEKYWRLIELYGKPIHLTEAAREPSIILKSSDFRINAFGGCNSINGTYEIDAEKNRIKFSKMVSTLMACPNMETEDKLKQALETADNYSTDGEFLSLNKARMAPLARFKVVYLP